MSLVTIATARVLINTSLSDAELQAVIDRVEAEITALIGAPQDAEGTVELTEDAWSLGESLFLRRPIASVTSVTNEDDEELDSDSYRFFSLSGEICLKYGRFDGLYTVVYKPVNENEKRISVTIEIVRLDIERTALKSESVAGEYSYQAPDFIKERRRLMRQLMFQAV